MSIRSNSLTNHSVTLQIPYNITCWKTCSYNKYNLEYYSNTLFFNNTNICIIQQVWPLGRDIKSFNNSFNTKRSSTCVLKYINSNNKFLEQFLRVKIDLENENLALNDDFINFLLISKLNKILYLAEEARLSNLNDAIDFIKFNRKKDWFAIWKSMNNEELRGEC